MDKICNQCGKRGKTLTHHKDFNHNNDIQSNRIELCYPCHALAHQLARTERINKEMKARRELERINYIDTTKPGWSRGMTWDELLGAKQGRSRGWG